MRLAIVLIIGLALLSFSSASAEPSPAPVELSGSTVKGLGLVVKDMQQRKLNPSDYAFFVEQTKGRMTIGIQLYDASTHAYGKGGITYFLSADGTRLLNIELRR